MFIKKITLKGFKSYGNRVDITGFDQSFNAITGFNGSGKSNILDAICFVLGLSKLEMARCHSFSDFIYKNGQTSITDASVTIEIDNSDGKFSNTEYRNNSVIVVRRDVNLKNQSKFYIEGFNVTKEKLLAFFQSVSLNIQNPHFLIMQGKIIKVISMKPIEILSMIQEAVGVSVYESKRKQNMAKIEKYDISLKEISYIIEESIKPKLNQLKEEEKSLVEFRTVTAELNLCNKIYAAYRYLQDNNIVNNADLNIQSKNDIIYDRSLRNEKIDEECMTISSEINTLQNKYNQEIGGELKELESILIERNTNLERINSNKKIKIDNIKEERDKITSLKTTYNKDNKKLENKKKDFEVSKNKLEKLKETNVENEISMKKAEKDFEAIQLGLSKGQDGEEAATLARQIMTAKDKLADVESSINRANLFIQHNANDLAQKKRKAKSDKDTSEKSSRDIEIKTKEIQVIQNELDNLDFNEERYNDIKSRLTQKKKDLRLLEDKFTQLQNEVSNSKFNYTKPNSDFDESGIIGVVCNLFTCKSPEHALALEKVCGGKLYNIVVSNDAIAQSLISGGRLTQRRTFLPMNKIRGRDTDLNVLRIAERLVGKGNVHFACNLVSYYRKLSNVMKHVFGDALICPNMDMAKKVAFADGIMKRTITYDGEIFDPSGTLTGGTLRTGTACLQTISEMNAIKEELDRMNVETQQLDEEFNRLSKISKPYYDLKSKMDLKRREKEILERRFEESSHYVLTKEIEDMEILLKQHQLDIQTGAEEKKTITKHINDLENKINNAEENREKEKKEAEEVLKSARKQFEISNKNLQKEEQNYQCLTQEIKHHEESVLDLNNQIKKLEADVQALSSEIEIFDKNIEEASNDIKLSEERYNDYKKKLNAKSNEISIKQKKLDSLNNEKEENVSLIKITQHEVEKIEMSIKEAKNNLKSLLSKNQWIKDEELYFNSVDSEYRILHDNFNHDEFINKLASLKSKKSTLSKSVNMKANIMHGEKQKEFDELQRKRTITLQDRKKLMKYMQDVEKQKDGELQKAWEKVNSHFGSIFGTLLPGSNAKLVPVKNNNINDGLEIKVSFGNVWKESLSELSGGQRSLVALSLVLALLKYNPAPLYILDEVDAALDQSHTQNIGLMIKKHFKDSQFIIVSLKDDMFSNANVLFQTKFIDGFSTVERICNSRSN